MKIGLLEDNTAIHEYMMIALQLKGHSVVTHTCGSSLLAKLFTEHDIHLPQPYDLVIIDLLLPGMFSGAAVIDHIRQSISPETLPIIVMSALSPSDLEEIQKRYPDIQVLRKPFAMKTLLQMIETSRDTRQTSNSPCVNEEV
jgi:DNA-binding response OmpR family regulator